MKRVDLIREIEALGCVLIRNGVKHDGTATQTRAHRKPCPDIEKSTSI